jgi:hypothetical protein
VTAGGQVKTLGVQTVRKNTVYPNTGYKAIATTAMNTVVLMRLTGVASSPVAVPFTLGGRGFLYGGVTEAVGKIAQEFSEPKNVSTVVCSAARLPA